MKHLGAEVGELGSLFEADGADAQGIGADARVGGHDAVDIGPDLDGAGMESAADQGAGVVRATAAQGGGDLDLRADEAAQNGYLARLQ